MNFAANKAAYDRDLGIEAEMPQLFFWQGVQYTGQQSQSVDSIFGTDVGDSQVRDMDLIVRISAFAAGVKIPREGDAIEIVDSVSNKRLPMRVTKSNTSPDGVAVTLSLNADN